MASLPISSYLFLCSGMESLAVHLSKSPPFGIRVIFIIFLSSAAGEMAMPEALKDAITGFQALSLWNVRLEKSVKEKAVVVGLLRKHNTTELLTNPIKMDKYT
jgi:hypothetical protein